MPHTSSPKFLEAVSRIADSQDGQLAWKFFILFSRFEYALKRDPRFLKAGDGKAEPNWDRFAAANNSTFLSINDEALCAAINFFKIQPPKRQLRANGKLYWSEPVTYKTSTPLLPWLLTVIRHVRNNLFHGGKAPSISVNQSSRDNQLVSHAICILVTCLGLDADLAAGFMEGFE